MANEQKALQADESQAELNELLQIRREKLAELQAAGSDPFQQVRFERTHYTTDVKDNFDEMEGKTVRLAGRMMSKRIMGKASFSDLSDRYGRVQMYVKRDNLGDEAYKGFKKLDIGDIVGIEGEVFRTQKGEISVMVKSLTLLSKNLIPLPEKWHGLKDTDMRYRQRYVDLIINPEVRDTFEKRSAIVREIRNFMDSRGFMEVETPCLNTIAGGAAARPFITHHNALDIDMYMRIATELHLKRLIVGGMEQVYEIGRIFRNEGMDTRHNPEFTTIELYQAYTDYNGMMDITEDMVIHVCEKVLGTTKVTYQGTELDFSKGWKRITYRLQRHDGHHRGYGHPCLRKGARHHQGDLSGNRAGLLQGLEAHHHGGCGQGVFRSGLYEYEWRRGSCRSQGKGSDSGKRKGKLGRPACILL